MSRLVDVTRADCREDLLRQFSRRLDVAKRIEELGQAVDVSGTGANVAVGRQQAVELRAFVVGQRAVNVSLQERFVVRTEHHADLQPRSSSPSRCRAVCSRDLTVLDGTPNAVAISSYDNPAKCRSTTTAR